MASKTKQQRASRAPIQSRRTIKHPKLTTTEQRAEVLRTLATQSETEAFALEVEARRRRALLDKGFEGISDNFVAEAEQRAQVLRKEADGLARIAKLSRADREDARRRWLEGDENSDGWIARIESGIVRAEALCEVTTEPRRAHAARLQLDVKRSDLELAHQVLSELDTGARTPARNNKEE